MEMDARPAQEGTVDQLRPVRGRVIEDQMQVQFRWRALIGRVEEVTEYVRAVSLAGFANHGARLHV